MLPNDRTTWISTLPAVAPRLKLRQDPSARSILDGTWWPRSRATVPELTNLIIGLDGRPLAATRIMLNPGAWDEHPRRISVNGRIVRVGWFTTLDAHLLIATAATDRRVDLLIVPSTVSAGWAAAAATMATDGEPTLGAAAIVSAVSTRAPTQPPGTPAEDAGKSERSRRNGHRPGDSLMPAHVAIS